MRYSRVASKGVTRHPEGEKRNLKNRVRKMEQVSKNGRRDA